MSTIFEFLLRFPKSHMTTKWFIVDLNDSSNFQQNYPKNYIKRSSSFIYQQRLLIVAIKTIDLCKSIYMPITKYNQTKMMIKEYKIYNVRV